MKALARQMLKLQSAVAVLALTALACLPIALRMQAPDAAMSVLLPTALTGAVAGFLVPATPLRKTPVVALFGLAGLVYLFLRLGQLGQAFAAALDEAMRMLGIAVLPVSNPEALMQRVAGWWTAQGHAWEQVAFFGQRSAAWLIGMLRGAPIDDPAPRTFFLAAGMLLLGAWAGWRLSTRNDPLGALLPVTGLLGLTLSVTVQDRWPLWLHVAALLLLVSITNLARLRRSWEVKHTDYSDSIQEDSFLIASALIIVVLSAAFTVSSVTVKDVVDRFRRQPDATTGTAARNATTRGAAAASIESGTFEGLQNTHVITAGPVLSGETVMYVHTGDLPAMPPAASVEAPVYYWRGATYQAYTGRAWVNPIREDLPANALAQLIAPGAEGYRKVHGIVRLQHALNGTVYWTGTLLDTDVPMVVAWRAGPESDPGRPASLHPANADVIGAMAHEQAGDPRDTYTFDSLLRAASEDELRAAPARYPRWVSERYLQLPKAVPERVRALARDITAQGVTPYDRALRLERYLRAIPYSLEVPAPPSEQDATDFFLFDLKKGYCDYYATAMTVMARSAGLPARLVTGYASGSYDSTTAEYIVSKADAHAWTEIYFTGIGWIEFEPTAGEPAPQREGQASQAAAHPVASESRPRWFVLPAIDARRVLLALWAIPLMLAAAISWAAIDSMRLRRMRAEAAMRRIYLRMRRATRPLTGATGAGETVLEHARAVATRLGAVGGRNRAVRTFLRSIEQAVSELSQLYMLCLFSPRQLSRAQHERAIRVWQGARWRLAVLGILLVTMNGVVPSERAASEARHLQQA